MPKKTHVKSASNRTQKLAIYIYVLKKASHIRRLLQLGRMESLDWCCFLVGSILFTAQNSSVLVFMMQTSFGDCASDCAWFLITYNIMRFLDIWV